jgi:hypothetical protein
VTRGIEIPEKADEVSSSIPYYFTFDVLTNRFSESALVKGVSSWVTQQSTRSTEQIDHFLVKRRYVIWLTARHQVV